MSYQVELTKDVGWPKWKWSVILPNGHTISDWSLTKIGALWLIERSIKNHKKSIELLEQTETWEIS